MRKNKYLYHLMDAYTLGAITLYSYLLGGKLIALIAVSDEIRQFFQQKCFQQKSIRLTHQPELILITTTLALGRSFLYNHLSMNGKKVFISLCFTNGWGHFHFSNGTFDKIKTFLQEKVDPIVKKYNYSDGPNWRFQVIKRCLKYLGLPTKLLQHGIKHEVFVAPLAADAREFLHGKIITLNYYKMHGDYTFAYFKQRWLISRATHNNCYQTFNKEASV